MSDEISDADALAAAERVLSLPPEEQIPYLIRFAQHVGDERDRLRAEKAHLVEVNAALRTRPDLAERAPLVMALVEERDRLRAVVEQDDWAGVIMRIMTTIDGGRRVWGDPLLEQVVAAVAEVEAERDRLRTIVEAAVLALDAVLTGDLVDMKVTAMDIIGRTQAALKKALDGKEGT